MSRGIKSGLDYFPLDVDFFEDEKIQFISAKFGSDAEVIVIKLLCRIYRNGYFLPWNDDSALLFLKRCSRDTSLNDLKAVIDELLYRNFFNSEIYSRYKILTSNGIQVRYFEATKRRKRINVYKEYLIADTKGYNVNIIRLNVNNNPQSKVKESKEKKSKEKNIFVETSIEFRLAKLLLDLITERKPTFKKPDMQKWSIYIDQMIRYDNRDPKIIEQVIRWCQADVDFWQNNILSTKKLRIQFDQLELKMAASKKDEPEESEEYRRLMAARAKKEKPKHEF